MLYEPTAYSWVKKIIWDGYPSLGGNLICHSLGPFYLILLANKLKSLPASNDMFPVVDSTLLAICVIALESFVIFTELLNPLLLDIVCDSKLSLAEIIFNAFAAVMFISPTKDLSLDALIFISPALFAFIPIEFCKESIFVFLQ